MIHIGRDPLLVGVRSHFIDCQKVESSEAWCLAHFSFCTPSRTYSQRMIPSTFRVCLHISSNSVMQISQGHSQRLTQPGLFLTGKTKGFFPFWASTLSSWRSVTFITHSTFSLDNNITSCVCNPSIQKAETGGSQIQVETGLKDVMSLKEKQKIFKYKNIVDVCRYLSHVQMMEIA